MLLLFESIFEAGISLSLLTQEVKSFTERENTIIQMKKTSGYEFLLTLLSLGVIFIGANLNLNHFWTTCCVDLKFYDFP